MRAIPGTRVRRGPRRRDASSISASGRRPTMAAAASRRTCGRSTCWCCTIPACRARAAALDRLCDPAARVSAHYLVEEDGTLWRLVPEARRAFHAGVSCWQGERDLNFVSIGVEIVNPGHEWGYRPFPEAQMAAVEALCRDILSRHRIPPYRVVGHSDIAPDRKIRPRRIVRLAAPRPRRHRPLAGARARLVASPRPRRRGRRARRARSPTSPASAIACPRRPKRSRLPRSSAASARSAGTAGSTAKPAAGSPKCAWRVEAAQAAEAAAPPHPVQLSREPRGGSRGVPAAGARPIGPPGDGRCARRLSSRTNRLLAIERAAVEFLLADDERGIAIEEHPLVEAGDPRRRGIGEDAVPAFHDLVAVAERRPARMDAGDRRVARPQSLPSRQGHARQRPGRIRDWPRARHRCRSSLSPCFGHARG